MRGRQQLTGNRRECFALGERAWQAVRVQDEIVFRFLDEGVAASARLLREQAPDTCRAVVGALPAAGSARHGI